MLLVKYFLVEQLLSQSNDNSSFTKTRATMPNLVFGYSITKNIWKLSFDNLI